MPKKPLFSWDPDTYKIQALENIFNLSNKDDMWAIKQEYTRLRDIAQKRLKRLAESEFKNRKVVTSNVTRFYNEKGEIVKQYMGFPKIRDIHPADIPAAMAQLAKFLGAKGSTVTGQRNRRDYLIQKFQEDGLNITEKTYDKFMEMLDVMRTRKIIYGSDKVADVVNIVVAQGLNWDQIINSPKLARIVRAPSKLKRIPKKAGNNIDDYLNKLYPDK